MALPKAVQAQADAANKLIDGASGDQPGEGNTSQQAPEPEQQQPAQQPSQPQQQAAPAPSVIDAPAGQQQQAAPQGNTDKLMQELETLRQQFKVLQGKYNHELPQYANQLRDLRERNAELEKQIEEGVGANDVSSAVETLKEVLDDESVKALQAIIRGELGSVTKRLETISGDVQRTQQTTTSQVQSTFYGTLNSMAKNWQSLNNDPGFRQYIENTARQGKALSQLIQERFAALDAPGVAEIFNEYDAKRQQQPQGDPLDGQIMPGQGGGGVNLNQAPARTITHDEYNMACLDRSRGKIDEAAFNKIQDQYYAENGIS